MPDAYTYIAKPTNLDYSYVNPTGREIYDETTLTYDDGNTFFDGVDQTAYTNIPKPANGVVNITVGMATGLLIPVTYSAEYDLQGDDGYTYIDKPTT